jgi:hypothetical protein
MRSLGRSGVFSKGWGEWHRGCAGFVGDVPGMLIGGPALVSDRLRQNVGVGDLIRRERRADGRAFLAGEFIELRLVGARARSVQQQQQRGQ